MHPQLLHSSLGHPSASCHCLYRNKLAALAAFPYILLLKCSHNPASVSFFFGAGLTLCYSSSLFPPSKLYSVLTTAPFNVVANRHGSKIFIFGGSKDTLYTLIPCGKPEGSVALSPPAPVPLYPREQKYQHFLAQGLPLPSQNYVLSGASGEALRRVPRHRGGKLSKLAYSSFLQRLGFLPFASLMHLQNVCPSVGAGE